jgi:hypothetical protein
MKSAKQLSSATGSIKVSAVSGLISERVLTSDTKYPFYGRE